MTLEVDPAYLEVSHRSEVVATRRGYTLLGLGFLVPGSAQVIYGNKRVGRFALKVWILAAIIVGVLAIVALFSRKAILGILGNPIAMTVIFVAAVVLGLFWLGLAINTYLIARPREMGRKKGGIFSGVALVMALVLVVGMVQIGSSAAAGLELFAMFRGGGNSTQVEGRYNILLLGSDSGMDRWSMRPDSITVASMSAATGRTVLFGLPRNLMSVPFANGSPLKTLYPLGYQCRENDDDDCEDTERILNAVYLLGQQNAALYPDEDDPGMRALLDAVEGITGLTMNYYILINMEGFADLVDAVGGLTISIKERVPVNAAQTKWIEAGANQHLTGEEALQYARTRSIDDDYKRMQRQKCVMTAMLAEMDPTTVAQNFQKIAKTSKDMASTSIDWHDMKSMVDLASKAKSLPLISVSFSPPLVTTGDPDYYAIRRVVADTIARSEALDAEAAYAATADPSASPTSEPAPTQDPLADISETNLTDDLSSVCSVG
ncbi:MAG: LCP family protein [Propionibacteriaceae bacterium]|nr:LCP family protein [Propionibacteriaceae bacterium]